MSDRARLWTFTAIVVACLIAGVGYFTLGSSDDTESATPERLVALAALAPVAPGAIVIRSLDRRAGRYGELAVVDPSSASAPAGTGLVCERVAANIHGGMCLARAKAFGVKYDAIVLGPDFRILKRVRLDGIPSRTRMSKDGRFAGVTSFVNGHSYASLGEFSTQTLILDRRAGRVVIDLEDLDVTHDGRLIDAVDVNFWGVTFAPSGPAFYATLATGDKTYLIRGARGSRKAQVIRENVECPSISPDGRRIAYKKRIGDPAIWRFHVLDLASMRDVATAETRPIDDQIEWLDRERLLYRVDEEVWTVPADGSGAPARFLPRADSPAVVRG